MIIRLCVPGGGDRGTIIDEVMRRIAEDWGGVTNYQTIGGWVDASGAYISDVVNVLECVVNDTLDGYASPEIAAESVRTWFDNIASEIRERMGETAVFYSVGVGYGRMVTEHTILGPTPKRKVRPIGDGTGLL